MNEELKKQLELEKILFSYVGEDRVIKSHEKQEEIAKLPVVPSINLGIKGIDLILDGVQEGELIVVSGETGEGKSLLCQSITVNFEKQGINCVWFPYELGDRQFLARFRDSLPLFYLPRKLSNNGIDWVEQRIKEAKLKYNCKIVFIDHIGFLSDVEKRRDGKRFELESLIRKIKRIAVDENLIIFAMWHNRKPPEWSKGHEPDSNDLKESSAIGQDSDSVLMIKRVVEKDENGYKNYNTGKAKISIVKNRRGGIIKKSVFLQINEKGYFEELENYTEQKIKGF